MRRSILACGLLLACAGITTAAAAAARSGGTSRRQGSTTAHAHTVLHAVEYWKRHLRRARTGARRWLTVIHGRLPHRAARSLEGHSIRQLRSLARRWHHREHAAWRRATHPPHLDGWLCIHQHEGSWADAGAPYWGGLQMDLSFQGRYGGWLLRHKGTADHWSPLEQIWVAVHAWRGRGFAPWPNTARFCGLY